MTFEKMKPYPDSCGTTGRSRKTKHVRAAADVMRKAVSVFLTAVLLAVSFALDGSACTAVYAGSGLTEDGSTIFARLEEYSAEAVWPKLFDAVPEGVHKRGELYTGCYGFSWVFTHDSYGYTAFCDNNSQGICPDCGGTHAHTPYQAAGTNSMGVTVHLSQAGRRAERSGRRACVSGEFDA